MVYLFVFLFVLSNLLIARKYEFQGKLSYLVLWSPAIFVFLIVPALQFGVGTDYFSYRDMYLDPTRLDFYFDKGEYLFFYTYKIFSDHRTGSQSYFYFASALNTIVFFLTLTELKFKGFRPWLVFLIFFTVTGIYHNQMNGVRQYISLMFFPLIMLYSVRNLKIRVLFLICISSLFHSTGVLSLTIPIFTYLASIKRGAIFLLFLVSPFLYVFSAELVDEIVSTVFPFYEHYLSNQYGEARDFSSIISKLYYLPLFIMFWLYYLRNDADCSYDSKLMKVGILIWASSYWMILLYLYFGFFYRIASVFVFFYIFPIYYLLHRSIGKRKYMEFAFWTVYICAPYIAKVTFLARGEFLYHIYLW